MTFGVLAVSLKAVVESFGRRKDLTLISQADSAEKDGDEAKLRGYSTGWGMPTAAKSLRHFKVKWKQPTMPSKLHGFCNMERWQMLRSLLQQATFKERIACTACVWKRATAPLLELSQAKATTSGISAQRTHPSPKLKATLALFQ